MAKRNTKGSGASSELPRILLYGLPRSANDDDSRRYPHAMADLWDEPLLSSVSFLDFNGVLLFAGAFEQKSRWYHMECVSLPDLDLREREFNTGLEEGGVFIFLVPHMKSATDDSTDLFRRVMARFGVYMNYYEVATASASTEIPEFKDYVSRFGSGYISFDLPEEHEDWMTPICTSGNDIYGFVCAENVFVLPSITPQTHEQLIQVTSTAVEAVISYRSRVSKEMPGWTEEFSFQEEASKRAEANRYQQRIIELGADIAAYTALKGALCFQSGPLVDVVVKLFARFLDMKLAVDDKCIEDALLYGNTGAIAAVFEIKGVNGNFTRKNINQLDSHRERLSLSAECPGVLIMNTFMSAKSLKDKEERPHPDIIKKAHADNVLLIRTIDLLRCADAIERGAIEKERMCDTILNESGWLRVDGDNLEVVKC